MKWLDNITDSMDMNLSKVPEIGASLVAQLVKNPPAMWETWVLSLGWEDPLEKGKGTHSSILAWRITWTYSLRVTKHCPRLSDFHFHFSLSRDSGEQRSLVCYSPWGCKKLDITQQLNNNIYQSIFFEKYNIKKGEMR